MANTSSRPANLHDVARIAGVSYQTVSRVINNHPYVSDDTRERVLQAIEALNYHPNRAARSLITGRSQTLQIVTTDLNFHNPIASMVNTAHKHGYQMGLSHIPPTSNPDELRQFIYDLKSRPTDGLLIISIFTNFNLDEFKRLCSGVIPFVQVGGSPDPGTPSVMIDQRFGARLSAEHLISLGHRNIAAVPGPLGNYDARMRHEATQAVLAENGLSLTASVEGVFTPASGYQNVMQIFEQKKKFTALICGNDEMAVGAIHALNERGLKVPQDVSVVGFDDIPSSSFVNPPLTTVRQDFITLGDLSVDHLVALIKDPEKPNFQRTIYPQLMVRKSTQQVR
jgi:DNA-binding LacI/PurR family transcriptional regulator